MVSVCQIRTRPGGSENPKELTLGWGRGAGVEESSRAEQIEPMLDTATVGSVKRQRTTFPLSRSLKPVVASKMAFSPVRVLHPSPES